MLPVKRGYLTENKHKENYGGGNIHFDWSDSCTNDYKSCSEIIKTYAFYFMEIVVLRIVYNEKFM